MTETIDQQPKYHPSFTDGDLLVIANDHTHFAAQCERLARGSQVFKNMVDLPKPACGVNGDSTGHSEVRREENVIDMDVDSKLAGSFFAFLGADIPLFPPTSFADTCKLMRLCDQFEASDKHVDLVRDRLISESKGNLWKLLVFASKMDDRKLGSMALRKMNLESFSHGREPGDEHDRLSFSGKNPYTALHAIIYHHISSPLPETCRSRVAPPLPTVISDMLEPPPLRASPIDIELSTDLLEVLLDYITSLHPKELKTNFDDTKALFLASEKWGIDPSIMASFRQRMYNLSVNDPWDLLVWASERNDRHMARAALEKMTPETFARGRRRYWDRSSFLKSSDELPPSWQWRLLRAALDNPTEAVVTRHKKYEWTSRKKYVYESEREIHPTQECWPYRMPWKDVGKMFEERKDEHFDNEEEDLDHGDPSQASGSPSDHHDTK